MNEKQASRIIFSIEAVSLGHKDMVLGNLMGSVIANSSLVLGVTILIFLLPLATDAQRRRLQISLLSAFICDLSESCNFSLFHHKTLL